MKKYLKIILIIFGTFILLGCTKEVKPSDKVEFLISKYVKNDKDIIDELNTYLDMQDLNKEQIERYKNIIKLEYSTLTYEIKNESIENNRAKVEVEISVKDLYKPSANAQKYLEDNPTYFYTDGKYDQNKFIDYKLKLMETSEDRVTYLIYFSLTKKDNVWTFNDISEDTLEKIHGIFDYENN